MSVITRDQGKAQQLARETVKGWDVGDLEYLITDHIEEAKRRRIFAEIEPKYDALEKESVEIFRALAEFLNNKEQQTMLDRYSEIQRTLSMAEAIGGFHLGCRGASTAEEEVMNDLEKRVIAYRK